MQLIVIEDEAYRNLSPLTDMRPISLIICGANTLLEKQINMLKPDTTILLTREYLRETLKMELKELHIRAKINPPSIESQMETLIINASILANPTFKSEISSLKEGELLLKNKTMIAFKPTLNQLDKLVQHIENLRNKSNLLNFLKSLNPKIRQSKAETIEYPWDPMIRNPEQIVHDISLKKKVNLAEIDSKAIIKGNQLYTQKNVIIEAYTLIDTRSGPIYIEENTTIDVGTKIEGPCYIHENCKIFSALIRPGVTLGPVTRIGGEIEQTIIQGYTNKYHQGFIGHSYICQWVNIGAGTNNSDLKNTYGTVKVNINNKRIDTGQIKIGCFIGDHVKTAIGTQIYTGKKIGIFSHLYGIIKEDVPPFTIYGLKEKPEKLRLQSIIETQKRVFGRRGKEQTKAHIKLIEYLYNQV